MAELIVSELESEGISTEHIARITGGESPFSFIHVDESSGERTIFHRSGANLQKQQPPIDFSCLAQCDVLLVDDVYPGLALDAARRSREAGVPVVADLVPRERNHGLLRYVDVLIAPRHYARDLGFGDEPEKALDGIHALGPSVAVITMGADGWVYSGPGGRGSGPAYEVDVVDTTGAGDTFHGAFAYALARGWDVHRCCDFAAAVAAIKCTKPGGRTGLPSLDQAIVFLQERSALDWSWLSVQS